MGNQALSKKEHWDSIYATAELALTEKSARKKNVLKKFLGNWSIFFYEGYREYIFWSICKEYLPNEKGLKILEIGSAPGANLLNFHRIFGYEPFGVEYSEKGVLLNKKLFEDNNISVENVIQNDIFSDEFQKKYKEKFDIVFSSGFIEHFTDQEKVTRAHENLVKRNGICVVSIPNVKGVNYVISNLFNHPVIAIHNLTIMNKKSFKECFKKTELNCVFLNYYGTFDFGLFNANSKFKSLILKNLHYSQGIVSIAFYCFFRQHSFESRFCSPHILYIGKKAKNE